MAETDDLKDDERGSRSPSHHNDQQQHQQQLEESADNQFPHGFPPFYGYPPDGTGSDGGAAPNGVHQFFPFPPGTAPPGLYHPFAANMPGGPLFPIPIGQLTSVNGYKQKRLQVKNACVNCAQACKKCDNTRPCERCKKYGIADSCMDSARKERKKGIKRGPYKRRLKSGATVTQEQDGQDAEWHPSHDQPATVDPSILPQPPSGSNPTFGGPEGYYSYPYPYPLPAPGESGQNGEPGVFPPPHFFPAGYPYPHWQPPFGQGDILGGPEDPQPQPEESSANGSGNGSGTSGSARTLGNRRRAGPRIKATVSGSASRNRRAFRKSVAEREATNTARADRASRRGKGDGSDDQNEDQTLMDINSVTDPTLLGDELASLDPQVTST